MPKLSKAEKRRHLVSDLARPIAGLAAIVGYLAVATHIEGMNGLIIGAVVAGVILVVAYLLLYRILTWLLVPKTEPKFVFDGEMPSRNQQASAFEHEVAALIQQMTGKRTEVVGGSGDGGIDIKVWDGTRLVGIVQCKNLAPNKYVYPAHIRDLNTVKHYHQVDRAYLVSTGRFSDDSRQLARELHIDLIDGDDLKRLHQKALSSA